MLRGLQKASQHVERAVTRDRKGEAICWNPFWVTHDASPELAPLFAFCVWLFWGSLCFPLTRQKYILFAGVLIPAKDASEHSHTLRHRETQ